MIPYYSRDGVTIYHNDCIEAMAELETDSVSLIFVDWPYYKVKDEPWDRQWDKPELFLDWIGQTLEQSRRILKPNGSFYGCASPEMSSRVEAKVGEYFKVLNNIRWYKDDGWHKKTEKEAIRKFLTPWESIIFAEQWWSDEAAAGESGYYSQCQKIRGFLFEPLRSYLDGERQRAGWSKSRVNKLFNGPNVGQYWWQERNWQLPTKENYEILQKGFNNGHLKYFNRDYEDLRRDYEDLRRDYEDLRRPFNGNPDAPYTDIWTFKPVKDYPGKHPTEKPLAMLEHIIEISSRPGDVVLDFCMGSGTTLRAAKNLDRQAIGIDAHEPYCKRAIGRMSQPLLFRPPQISNKIKAEQLELIAA